jgi:MoxR-like ATPase
MQITNLKEDFYKPSDELLAAINTALFLRRPLLLSGEPGTGKTECADFIARQLTHAYSSDFKYPKALRFNTKSGSQSSDLFYYYDVVAHFGDKEGKKKEGFISFNTLGIALLATFENQPQWEEFKNYKSDVLGKKPPFSSVVLIDEIDKAPRDFPNDLLAELEKPPFKFNIKELDDFEVRQKEEKEIFIVITTNNEKGLPDAFLRRCVFHHINFPSKENLLTIVKANLKEENKHYETAIDKFWELRNKNLVKKPATSELIDWIACLKANKLLSEKLADWKNADNDYKKKIKESFCILAKSKNDFETLIA